jgi:hypothetical protein
MIAVEVIPVQLKINSPGSVNTGRYFSQNDNSNGKLSFTIYREDNSEIDYAQVAEAYMTLKFQDGTHMEPCACDVGVDSITYELCTETLSKTGTVSGILRLYGEANQVITTNVFRFVIIADILDGCILANEDKASLVNELLSKLANISFKEDARDAAELIRISNEAIRVSNENARISSETTRQSNETTRQSNESSRESAFDTMQTDYALLTDEIRDSLNRMVVFNIPGMKNPPLETLSKILFTIPVGYTFTITEITLISDGDAVGINATDTCNLQLIEGSDIISDTTFNDVNLFPSTNITKKLTIIDGLIDKDDNVYINIVNGAGVTTPEFSLQINYDIAKII